jgi:diguanylate cyclase (GGDEF)-like protein
MSAGKEHTEPVREHRPAFRWEWLYILVLVPWIQNLAELGQVQVHPYELLVKAVLSACIALGVGVLIRQNRKIDGLNHEVERLSITDDLTGLYNFRHLQEELVKEVERSGRTERPLSLVFYDVDNLKEINDRWGHQAGSRILRSMGGLLPSVVRKNMDSAFRWGGDEFVIMLPETDRDGAFLVAERLRRMVEDNRIPEIQEYHVTISVGVATLHPGESPAVFLQRVDMALYEAKRSGKNRTTAG